MTDPATTAGSKKYNITSTQPVALDDWRLDLHHLRGAAWQLDIHGVMKYVTDQAAAIKAGLRRAAAPAVWCANLRHGPQEYVIGHLGTADQAIHFIRRRPGYRHGLQRLSMPVLPGRQATALMGSAGCCQQQRRNDG